jgi:hypothetical protein
MTMAAAISNTCARSDVERSHKDDWYVLADGLWQDRLSRDEAEIWTDHRLRSVCRETGCFILGRNLM